MITGSFKILSIFNAINPDNHVLSSEISNKAIRGLVLSSIDGTGSLRFLRHKTRMVKHKPFDSNEFDFEHDVA